MCNASAIFCELNTLNDSNRVCVCVFVRVCLVSLDPHDDGDDEGELKPAVRKPSFTAAKGGAALKGEKTRIGIGPQAPARTMRPEDKSAYPVSRLILIPNISSMSDFSHYTFLTRVKLA